MPPNPVPRWREFKLWRWFRNLAWSSKLMLSFVVLILSSASATVAIGNIVLGGQIINLARSKADFDLRTASQYWDSKITRMQGMVRVVAYFLEKNPAAAHEAVSRMNMNETAFDFAGIADAEGAVLFHEPPLSSPLRLSSSFNVAAAAMKEGAAMASPLLAPLEDVSRESPALRERLDKFNQNGEVMLIMAAAPIKDGGKVTGVVYGGFLVNGANEFTRHMIDRVVFRKTSDKKLGTATTVFQFNTRIATSSTEENNNNAYNIPMLSSADDKVSEEVLKNGRLYVGVARVIGENYYTAYKPVRDVTGRIIGMLGIGTAVYEYKEAQTKTIVLFSTLITLGMIFGFIMTYLFSVWLSKPIKQLAHGMSVVADGDLTHKVRINSSDELGLLAGAFNRMVRTVKERDLMMREMTENRLSEVEKQISIGRLAAGVAHEINNPLTAILSLSSLILRHLPDDDPRKEDMQVIVAETTRCRQIVSSLLDFARERPTTKSVVDVNQVVRDTMALANKYDSLQRVSIDIHYYDQPLYVLADPRQIQQVFINLILNAGEAVEEAKALGKGLIRISVDEDSSGEYVHVQVKDSGTGIPEDNINKIFAPFFTTKGKSKGTGLGLSVSLGIVKKHNGAIQIESKIGVGTTATVILPRHRPEAGKTAAS